MTKSDFLGRAVEPSLDHEPCWNGAPVTAIRGTAVVADDPRFPAYWARREGLIGQRIAVVRVDAPHGVMFLDDRRGDGWVKVMNGGTARFGHAECEIEPDTFFPSLPNSEKRETRG